MANNNSSNSNSSDPISLTTIYSPPASCAGVVTFDGLNLWQFGINQTNDPDCYPPSYTDLSSSYYSPGICPHAWTSAGELSHSSGFDAMCCPSSYTLSSSHSDGYNYCYSSFSTPLTNVYSTSTLAYGPIPSNPTLSQISAAGMSVVADVIQVQWQNSDRNILALMKAEAQSTSTHRPSTTAASPGSTISSPAAATSSGSSDSDSSQGGLSTGSKAAIGVLVPVVFALLALAAFLLIRRRRRNSKYPEFTPTSDTKEPIFPGYHELEQHENRNSIQEMDGQFVGELPCSDEPAELEHREPPVHTNVSTAK